MSSQIDHLLTETRRFAPSPDFAANAVGAAELYAQADADREGFWAEQARALQQIGDDAGIFAADGERHQAAECHQQPPRRRADPVIGRQERGREHGEGHQQHG